MILAAIITTSTATARTTAAAAAAAEVVTVSVLGSPQTGQNHGLGLRLHFKGLIVQ